MDKLELKYYQKLEQVAEIWQETFAKSSLPYFCSLQWHKVVLTLLDQTFITKKSNRLSYFVANVMNNKNAVNVVGFFFIKEAKGKKVIQFTHLLGPSDYYDFIYSDDLETSVLKQLIIQIGRDNNINNFSFSHIKKDSKLYKALQSFSSFKFEPLKCVCIHLEEGYESHLKKLSKNVRQNLRTAKNKLSKNGVVKAVRFLTNEDSQAIDFIELKTIYQQRNANKKQYLSWKSKIYKLLDYPFQTQKDMFDLKATQSTDFVLGVLRLDDFIAAYFFGFKSKRGIEINRVAINDDFKQFSPGMLLLDEYIQDSFTNNMLKIDLTVGDEKYKYDLGGETHEIFNINGRLCLD